MIEPGIEFVIWLTGSGAPVPPPGDPLGPVAQDPDAVRNTACHLVASDDVCTVTTTGPADPSVVRPTAPSGGGIGVASLLLWLLLGAAVVLLVGMIVRSIVGRGRPAKAPDEDDVDDGEELVDALGTVAVDRSREPVNWRSEADAHRRAGRYRESLRCRYRALVGDLARSGLIDEIPGRTTGEERSQLRRVRPAAHSPFSSAADLFDGAWYGRLEVGEGDDDAFIELERQVLQASGGGGR